MIEANQGIPACVSSSTDLHCTLSRSPLLTDDPTVLVHECDHHAFQTLFWVVMPPHYNYALSSALFASRRWGGRVGDGARRPKLFVIFRNVWKWPFRLFLPRRHRVLLGYTCSTLAAEGEPASFAFPKRQLFATALVECGVNESSIFAISENSEFWPEWRFGKDSPVGKGITAIYANDDVRVVSIDEIANTPQSFVEIGNLIHILSEKQKVRELFQSRMKALMLVCVNALAIILQGKTPMSSLRSMSL